MLMTMITMIMVIEIITVVITICHEPGAALAVLTN